MRDDDNRRDPSSTPTAQQYAELRLFMSGKYTVEQINEAVGTGVAGRSWDEIRADWGKWMVDNATS